MPNWILAAATTDCPPGAALETVAGDKIVALFNVDGTYYALDGVCPHQGGPLGKGVLEGCIVSCAWHGWQFDVTNGQHQASSTLHHPTYPTRVDDEGVWVDIETSEAP